MFVPNDGEHTSEEKARIHDFINVHKVYSRPHDCVVMAIACYDGECVCPVCAIHGGNRFWLKTIEFKFLNVSSSSFCFCRAVSVITDEQDGPYHSSVDVTTLTELSYLEQKKSR